MWGVGRGVVSGVAVGVAVGVALSFAFWLSYFRLLAYPFDSALATVSYFRGRWWPDAAFRAWRWHPIAWNEVIWLPLPYASKMLTWLVRQNLEEGFQQILFVATERRLQRGAAWKALTEVLLQALEVETIAEMADGADHIPEIADSLAPMAPAELVAALPRFNRTAQHLAQYLTLQGAYRRGEALQAALSELKALQTGLIVSPGRLAPRLLRVAGGWERLLAAEQEALRDSKETARDVPNPFVFGNPVTERDADVFTGRHDVVRHIEQCILGARKAPTMLLHGPRRMGKTSILCQLGRLLGPDFAPAVVDCQNPAVTNSAASLLSYLSRTLSTGLQKRQVTLEPLTRDALMSEPFSVFDEWLDRAERAMPDSMRALLCLDEYEHLQEALNAGWGEKFLDALRHTLQHRPKVVLMFTGSHTFEEQGPVWTDRFLSARRVRVSFLSRQEVIPLLTKPIPEFDMTYAAGALDVLLDATTGQPFLTQAVAFELVQFLNEHQRKEATVADVETAIARALESSSEYFANVWYDAGDEGQAILRALVRGEAPPDFPRARARLHEHDVLKDSTFAVPMVQRWVVKKITTEN
jgi:hypothetical protein